MYSLLSTRRLVVFLCATLCVHRASSYLPQDQLSACVVMCVTSRPVVWLCVNECVCVRVCVYQTFYLFYLHWVSYQCVNVHAWGEVPIPRAAFPRALVSLCVNEHAQGDVPIPRTAVSKSTCVCVLMCVHRVTFPHQEQLSPRALVYRCVNVHAQGDIPTPRATVPKSTCVSVC